MKRSVIASLAVLLLSGPFVLADSLTLTKTGNPGEFFAGQIYGPYSWNISGTDNTGKPVDLSLDTFCLNFRILEDTHSVTEVDVSDDSVFQHLAWLILQSAAFGGSMTNGEIQWAIWIATYGMTPNAIEEPTAALRSGLGLSGTDDGTGNWLLYRAILAAAYGTEQYHGRISWYKPVDASDESQGILVFQSVPEPSTLLLIGAGMIVLAPLIRRRK